VAGAADRHARHHQRLPWLVSLIMPDLLTGLLVLSLGLLAFAAPACHAARPSG